MDFAKPQLEVFGLQASFDDLCCGASPKRNRAWFPSVPRGLTDACTTALQHPERSCGRRDLVLQLRIETFRDVAVGLILVANSISSRTLTAKLCPTHLGCGRRDPWSSRLGPCSAGRSPAQPLVGSGFWRSFRLQPVDQVRDRAFQLPRRARQLRNSRPSTISTSPAHRGTCMCTRRPPALLAPRGAAPTKLRCGG